MPFFRLAVAPMQFISIHIYLAWLKLKVSYESFVVNDDVNDDGMVVQATRTD